MQTKQFSYSPSEPILEHPARDHGTPGRRTLSSQLPPPRASAAPIQCKPAPASADADADGAGGASADDWVMAALRPDLYAGLIQRHAGPEATAASPAPAGAGSALPREVRQKMEQAFGADFSAVRIHQGPQAAAIGALAYTQGTDIHFAPGHYDPHGARGQELLGHELTHVVQQSQGRVAATTQKKGVAINDDSALEREADQLGARAARGEPVHDGTAAPAAAIGAASASAPVQRNKTTDEANIPVQTHGNCGLFSILTALRAFGFSGEVQAKAIAVMDEMTRKSDDTFVGEIFTIDLMLSFVNELKIDGKPILHAEPAAFGSPEELQQLLAKFKDNDDVALLIGYSKPDEYDNYYAMRGQALHDGTTDSPELAKALDDKVNVKDFKVKDAHWGMINRISDGSVDIADSIKPYGPDKDHGYNTLMRTDKLYNSNTSLAKGEFDWSGYLDTQNDTADYNTMTNAPTTKDLDGNQRYENIQQNGMKEKLDLSGRLVVVTVTEAGAQLLGKH